MAEVLIDSPKFSSFCHLVYEASEEIERLTSELAAAKEREKQGWDKYYDLRKWLADEKYPNMNRAIRAALTDKPAKEYAAKNPLGGPATMFDAIADRIRAGEPMDAVLDDYGLTFTDKQ
jgi:hypothetical protein